MSNQTGAAKPKGCFFYGCLSLAIIALVVALFIAVGVYFAKRTVDGLITTYTDTAPVELEERPYSREQMQALQQRLESFRQALDKGQGDVELTLTTEDLNALIADNRDLKGRVLVAIEDDQVKGQVSIPLKDYGPLKLQGRYLNGSAAFKVQLENGLLDVRVDQIKVKEKPLPPLILNELKKQNLAQEAQSNPEAAGVIKNLESVEVTAGKVILRSKVQTEPVPADTPAPKP